MKTRTMPAYTMSRKMTLVTYQVLALLSKAQLFATCIERPGPAEQAPFRHDAIMGGIVPESHNVHQALAQAIGSNGHRLAELATEQATKNPAPLQVMKSHCCQQQCRALMYSHHQPYCAPQLAVEPQGPSALLQRHTCTGIVQQQLQLAIVECCNTSVTHS